MKLKDYIIIFSFCLLIFYFVNVLWQIVCMKIEEQKLKIERERETRKHIEKLLEMELERMRVEYQEQFKLIEEANKLAEELKCHQKQNK